MADAEPSPRPGRGGHNRLPVDVRQTILASLEQGMSLTEICEAEGMPDRSTVQRWMGQDAAFAAATTRARETGFEVRAEAVMVEVRRLDPQRARIILDSERWYLGKLSNAFSDNKQQSVKLDVELSVEARRWLGQGDDRGA